ncbi:PREDICTED: uncharacterized protein LOC105133438 [Populus euphratica]|uniref:Uncharacterized protein LOC105133438 n=1 Tax=Populus euphratica TaxID=75702 RepID=A0AAJ6UTB8_POPEU|nr:PREDICTED: uncharacterized protein LOC105133438 [Populus euphratica]
MVIQSICNPRSSLKATKDAKEWEEIRCPICMEHPHKAVLLRCSFGKGCWPYMCNTSYRHSNCLDQFCKFSVSSPSTEMLQEIPSVSNRTREELQLLGQSGHYESELHPKLCCPLCRGEMMRTSRSHGHTIPKTSIPRKPSKSVYGSAVVKPAREFMNSKLRSCSLETCDFIGNYSELRKHTRSDRPFIQPSKVDPQRQHDWTNFEYERDVEDMAAMLALTREEQEELLRDFDDLPAMISPYSIDEDEENEDRYSGDPYQVVNSSNPFDYPVVIMNIQFTNQLSRSMLSLDYI